MSRIAENGERIFDNFSYEEAEKINFTDGDEIRIHSLSNTPRNKILIKGSTAINGSIAFEDELALENIINPSFILETTYTPISEASTLDFILSWASLNVKPEICLEPICGRRMLPSLVTLIISWKLILPKYLTNSSSPGPKT